MTPEFPDMLWKGAVVVIQALSGGLLWFAKRSFDGMSESMGRLERAVTEGDKQLALLEQRIKRVEEDLDEMRSELRGLRDRVTSGV